MRADWKWLENQLLVIFVVMVMFMLISLVAQFAIYGKLSRMIDEKTLRVTEVHNHYHNSFDVKSYGELYLPGEMRTEIEREETP